MTMHICNGSPMMREHSSHIFGGRLGGSGYRWGARRLVVEKHEAEGYWDSFESCYLLEGP